MVISLKYNAHLTIASMPIYSINNTLLSYQSNESHLTLACILGAKNWIAIKKYLGKIKTNILDFRLTRYENQSLVSVEYNKRIKKVKINLEEQILPS